MQLLAIDFGYGYTKALTPGEKPFLVASTVGAEETIRFESDVISENGGGITVKVDGRWHFVGEQAELQSASGTQTLDATRTGSVEQLALFYATVSELVKTKEEEVVIVTGLPVADFDQRNKDALEDMLEGAHTVERRGKWTRDFETTGVHTIPQAMGSLFALVLNRRGKLVDGDLAEGRVAIIDVGTLTTNFVLVDRLRYVEVGSDSITAGMSEVFTKVAKDLKREHELDWTKPKDLGRVDRAVRERAVEVYGDRVNISGIVDRHIEALADAILSKARSLNGWGAGVDLKAVIVTGGGSLELAPYVRQAYPHTRTVGRDPQFANVTGYLRAGLRRFE